MRTQTKTAEQRARARFERLSPMERCAVYTKKIDKNTRGIAKLGSAVDYLTSDEDTVVEHRRGPSVDAPPELLLAIRNLLRERRPLRRAQEAELAEHRRLKAAREAMQVGKSAGDWKAEEYGV